ncbi:MAG: hypothetical protein ACKOX6_06205 [Bdellovibrio sp.]
MKTLNLFLILGLFFAGATASAQGIESSMTGFKLETCSTPQQCLTVTAKKTQGSQMKMLHTLTNPEVTITSSKLKTILQGDTGYIDIEENQIVLFKRSPTKIIETAIDLTDFTIASSETRLDK